MLPLFGHFDTGGEWGAVLMAGPALLQRLAAHDWSATLNPAQRARLQHWADAALAMAAGAAGQVAPVRRPRRPGAARSAGANSKCWSASPPATATSSSRALDLSPHTVKRHVANILDKLALSSRGQAAAWYREGR